MPDIWSFDPYTQIWSDTFINLGAAVANISPVILIDSGSVSSGPAIYVVSGSDVSGVFLDTVQRFYPKVGLVNTVATDPWPMKVSGIIANPGGCASANEKLYCFGGFENTSAPYNSAETWEYDPDAPSCSRWTHIGQNLRLASTLMLFDGHCSVYRCQESNVTASKAPEPSGTICRTPNSAS